MSKGNHIILMLDLYESDNLKCRINQINSNFGTLSY